MGHRPDGARTDEWDGYGGSDCCIGLDAPSRRGEAVAAAVAANDAVAGSWPPSPCPPRARGLSSSCSCTHRHPE